MLSTDKNVETFAQLIEVLKHYLGLQKEYLKLDMIDKVVSLLTAAALAFIFMLIILGALIHLTIAAAFWLSAYTGNAQAFLIISAFHLLLLLVVIIFRKSWIERPLVRFLAGLLLGK